MLLNTHWIWLCIFFPLRIPTYPWQDRKRDTLVIQSSSLTGGNDFEQCISVCTCYGESNVIYVMFDTQKTHTWPIRALCVFWPVATVFPLCVGVAGVLLFGAKEHRCSSIRPPCALLIILKNFSCSAGAASWRGFTERKTMNKTIQNYPGDKIVTVVHTVKTMRCVYGSIIFHLLNMVRFSTG